MTTSPTTEELIDMWSGAILYGHNVSDHLRKLHEENKRLRKCLESATPLKGHRVGGDVFDNETGERVYRITGVEDALNPTPQSQEDVG